MYPLLRDKKYSFRHPFLQFAEFDVENRQRVKCVSASEGVPLSTQWDKKGYYYSTQIAQFGLSHWSKLVLAGEKNQTKVVLEDGDSNLADWRGDVTRFEELFKRCILI